MGILIKSYFDLTYRSAEDKYHHLQCTMVAKPLTTFLHKRLHKGFKQPKELDLNNLVKNAFNLMRAICNFSVIISNIIIMNLANGLRLPGH